MKIAETTKQLIQGVFALSPYAWADRYLKRREEEYDPGTADRLTWREHRLELSERYIGYWFFASIALWLASPFLVGWIGALLFLRVIGILNKEMGVILFGTCKITEGAAVSATGRVIVLALMNYLTALFLMACLYTMHASFLDLPGYAVNNPLTTGLLQAVQVHFSLAGAFAPADLFTAVLTAFHSAYCFLFGALVISLFVSLLSVKPLKA